jgi:hypothetical protein
VSRPSLELLFGLFSVKCYIVLQSLKNWANVQLNRPQAVALLKELVKSKLIDPSWISIENPKEDAYKIKIKCIQDVSGIERFCANNKLVMEEQDGFCVISNPD